MNIHHILEKMFRVESISKKEIHKIFQEIAHCELEPCQLAATIMSMKMRGENPKEIAGAASALLEESIPFPSPDYIFCDIVGTGGDGMNSINISTVSAFVAAACGAKIAKHGNRSVSSNSGSIDLLSAFGISLDLTEKDTRNFLDDLGVCFLFAQKYHFFRNARKFRKKLKNKTLFNIIGPLINPAIPPLTLIGVYSTELVLLIAETIRILGYKYAFIFSGCGIDEVAIHTSTYVAEIKNGNISSFFLTPKSLGIKIYQIHALLGGNPKENCDIFTFLLQGNGEPAHAAAIAANISLLLKLFGQKDLRKNAQLVLEIIHSGRAYARVTSLAARGVNYAKNNVKKNDL